MAYQLWRAGAQRSRRGPAREERHPDGRRLPARRHEAARRRVRALARQAHVEVPGTLAMATCQLRHLEVPGILVMATCQLWHVELPGILVMATCQLWHLEVPGTSSAALGIACNGRFGCSIRMFDRTFDRVFDRMFDRMFE